MDFQRGYIVRVPTEQAAGLLSASGRQHAFVLEGTWPIEIVPHVGMLVDFAVDTDGTVSAVTAVDGLPRAAQAAGAVPRDVGTAATAAVQRTGARRGLPVLVAVSAFILAGMRLSLVTVQITPGLSQGVTLWQAVGVLNASGNAFDALNSDLSHPGLYGWLFVLAALAPLAQGFLGHPKASLLGVTPLALLVALVIAVWLKWQAFLTHVLGKEGAPLRDVGGEMLSNFLAAVHIGPGAYVLGLTAGFIAVDALRRLSGTARRNE